MDLINVRQVIKSHAPYGEIIYYKDKRKDGYRIVFKGMTKQEQFLILKELPNWKAYENTRESGRFGQIRRYGIQKNSL